MSIDLKKDVKLDEDEGKEEKEEREEGKSRVQKLLMVYFRRKMKGTTDE